MVTGSGCSATYRRKTTHPAITKAPFGGAWPVAGTEAHMGGSAISQRHMILRGYFAMRDHVDRRADWPPGTSTERWARTRLRTPLQQDVILPRLRIAQVAFGSIGLDCCMCSRDSLRSFKSLWLEATCNRCVSTCAPHDRC